MAAALAAAAKSVAASGEGGVQLAIDRATESLQRTVRTREVGPARCCPPRHPRGPGPKSGAS